MLDIYLFTVLHHDWQSATALAYQNQQHASICQTNCSSSIYDAQLLYIQTVLCCRHTGASLKSYTFVSQLAMRWPGVTCDRCSNPVRCGCSMTAWPLFCICG